MEDSAYVGRERAIAWSTSALASLYCAWLGVFLWRSAGSFGQMLEGLGAQIPPSTEFVVRQRSWLYASIFGGLVVIIGVKEFVTRDKRTSAMLTILITIFAQFLSHWFITQYYLPLFDLIAKLS
jgi:hypothetical protein